MAKKPTYKELEQEVKKLRKKAVKLERAGEALKESEARLSYLLTTSPAVIYTCKPAGDYAATFISENVKAQLGYEANEFVENPKFWADHIHPEDRPRVFADLPRVFEHGYYTHEYRFQKQDGTYRWMHDELQLLRDGQGNPMEIVGYWIDITERKQAEDAARKREAELEAQSHHLKGVVVVCF
jgi:PAS domain S-box-containing protein